MGQTTNFFVYWAAFSVNILTMTTGIAMSWSSPTLPKLTSNDPSVNPFGEPITTFQESWIASVPSIGSVFGTLIGGLIADKLGRKMTLIIFSTPFLGAYIAIALAKTVGVYYICRFLVGISAGCTLAVLPSYVAEIAEDSNRGLLGSIMGIMGASGYTFVFAVGPVVSIQVFAYLQIIPIILFYLMFVPFIPESPYYFIEKNKTQEAEACLKKIRSTKEVDEEMAALAASVAANKANKRNWKDIYSTKAAKKGLLITCGLLTFQELLGFSAVLGYMQTIFAASGTIIPSDTGSILIGVVQIISNIGATLSVDKLGRKKLLLASNIGCSVSLIALGIYFFLQNAKYNTDTIYWLPITSLMVFFISYNFGYGTLPLVICGELFSSNIKTLAASLSTCTCLLLSFIVTLGFPYLKDGVGMTGCFWIFGGISLLSIVFILIVVPETKNKSFNDIQIMLGQ